MSDRSLPSKGFLTRLADEPDAEFPYKAFEPTEIQAFEKFLRYVWKATPAFQKHHAVNFNKDEEEALSFAVAVVIEQLTTKAAEQFSWFLDLFHFEGLAAKRPNFTRTSIRQQCDFAFRRVAIISRQNSSLDCLFVEAKIVDRKHPMSYYVNSGITRFNSGAYAYAMPQAVLLGYVRATDQRLPTALQAHFDRDGGKRRDELEVTEDLTPFAKSRAGEIRMHSTVHKRVIPNASGTKRPGPITLFHLWLHVVADR